MITRFSTDVKSITFSPGGVIDTLLYFSSCLGMCLPCLSEVFYSLGAAAVSDSLRSQLSEAMSPDRLSFAMIH